MSYCNFNILAARAVYRELPYQYTKTREKPKSQIWQFCSIYRIMLTLGHFFFRVIHQLLGSPEFKLILMAKVKFPNFDFFATSIFYSPQNWKLCNLKIQYRSWAWHCFEILGPIQKEAPPKLIYIYIYVYSALNIVKGIRESQIIAFSVRIPYFSTLSTGVGNPDFSFSSTENELPNG